MKKVLARYKEKHYINENKIKNKEYSSIGTFVEEDNIKTLEFKEDISEFNCRLKRIVKFDEESITVIRESDDGDIYNEMFFDFTSNSVGFYIVKHRPSLGSNLSGRLLKFEYDNHKIIHNYELIVEGIYAGIYETTIYFDEI
ncbi:uncharacterized beta-barrel protein YwiB (DUF1934 family) [Bacilli bacterium PM5-3]|nr:uncharacterized beta-barrel protein YwiB (DUF1934 family) [Bacilli bacterium PM5-3]MDH6603914.1 uncharacterized beta-barrel protein YwiB (DUF1934 family) [Bacilli bacterium PM5-9]